MIGAKLTPFFMEKFTLINKARSRIKVFEPFEDSSKISSINNAILISYGCVFKQATKPVMKDSRVESI
uniref:Putative Hantavirus glycoprotein G1 n=1 Tax=uncultured Prochlorococcus marinus clone ASNC3046 TaxID=379369 RepID=Q1PKW6_PROMR|nr:putative Hantavirus glycoprotein G1 [uncultured Prochlorococcus marinus clone ASNC3046]